MSNQQLLVWVHVCRSVLMCMPGFIYVSVYSNLAVVLNTFPLTPTPPPPPPLPHIDIKRQSKIPTKGSYH